MPRSILSAATTANTVPKRFTIRLSGDDWDRLKKAEAAAEANGMTIDIDAALADFLRREIGKAERALAKQRPEATTDAASPEDDAASSGWPDHG